MHIIHANSDDSGSNSNNVRIADRLILILLFYIK